MYPAICYPPGEKQAYNQRVTTGHFMGNCQQLNENEAQTAVRQVKRGLQKHLRFAYEHAAQDCRTCPTVGACCLDAHFVNVHITRLEAVGVRQRLAQWDEPTRRAAYARARAAVARYGLTDEGDTFAQTYACPLFAPGLGCLVHEGGDKPAPCIQHACYERQEDLPPIGLQSRAEAEIERFNQAVYDTDWAWRPLPLWLAEVTETNDIEGDNL